MIVNKLLTTFILFAAILVPVLAASSEFTLAGNVGSMSLQQCSSQVNADGGLPRFGSNNSTQYTEDNSQKSILTNGRTYVKTESKIDQSNGNMYASTTDLATDHMGMAEDTAGMMNIQPNVPDSMCDQQNLDGTGGATGSYPLSESYEGKTGAVFHDGGTYASEVGLADGNVHLKGTVYSESKAIQYMNVLTSSKKGFDKNSTELNLDTYEHISYVGTTVDQITREDVTLNMPAEHNYGSYVDAFEEPLAEKEYSDSQVVKSVSEGRLEKTLNETAVNETVNATVNLTEPEIP